MARTPLLRALRRLFAEHRAARELGLPVEAFRERRARAAEEAARRGLTRRGFLTAAGAGAAGALVTLPRGARGADPVVAIVGAGIAGLACALELADRGIAATVYEASGRVGGRMFSNTSYFAGGQVAEWGGELIDTGHRTIRQLARRFGLPLDDLLAAQPRSSVDVYHFFGDYYPKTQADIDFAAISGRIVADEANAPFPTTFDSNTAAGRALDHLSVHDYIEARVPGGHGSALGMLLDTAYAIEYGADTTEQSALNLLYLLAFQPKPHELSVFGESDERFHIRGGNQRLPKAIADAMPGVVETGHKLVRIRETAAGRYRLTFERGQGTVEIVADLVVLAIPFAVLELVDYSLAGFDALKRRAIVEQGRAHNGKLQIQLRERDWLGAGPWPGKANGSSYSDTGYQASWEATRAQGGAPGILVLYSGGSVTDAMRTTDPFATATNAKVRQDAQAGLAQLAPVFPGLDWNGRAIQSLPHLSPFFRASYSYYKPGQYTLFAGYEAVRQGGVLFAGEHTSIDFQGFMEGGAEQGQRAARELARLI
jgi:monoamine oxidase